LCRFTAMQNGKPFTYLKEKSRGFGRITGSRSAQDSLKDRNAGAPAGQLLELRMAVHQGDVIVENGDLLGDGVNVAARLETLAEPGGI
jgi:adenylate cyclase